MASVGKSGPSFSVGRGIGAALMVTSVLLLASCNSATVNSTGTSTQDIDVMDKVRSLDILPRTPTQTGSTTTSSGSRAQPVVFLYRMQHVITSHLIPGHHLATVLPAVPGSHLPALPGQRPARTPSALCAWHALVLHRNRGLAGPKRHQAATSKIIP